jgi:hypothetical protein
MLAYRFPESRSGLRFFLVAAIALALRRYRLRVGTAGSGQRLPHINLLFREFSVSRPPDVPLIAFVRLDKCAFGRHNVSLAL